MRTETAPKKTTKPKSNVIHMHGTAEEAQAIEEMLAEPETSEQPANEPEVQTQEVVKPKRGRPAKEAAPDPEFSLADPVQTLGNLLIDQYFPDLKGVRIVYLFLTVAPTSAGQPVIVQTKKKAGMDAWGWQNFTSGNAGPGDAFFVIAVSESHWNLMDRRGREGLLMDHLAMCGLNKGKGTLKVMKPDIQTFVTTVNAKGFYSNKLKDLAQVGKKHIDQPEFVLEESA